MSDLMKALLDEVLRGRAAPCETKIEFRGRDYPVLERKNRHFVFIGDAIPGVVDVIKVRLRGERATYTVKLYPGVRVTTGAASRPRTDLQSALRDSGLIR